MRSQIDGQLSIDLNGSVDQNSQQSYSETNLSDNNTDNNKTDESNLNADQMAKDSEYTKKTAKFVCDIIGCNKQFSYLKCFEKHKSNEHPVFDTKQTIGKKDVKPNYNHNSSDNELERLVEKREMNGREKLLCRLCEFGHNLRFVVKQHIINSHLTQKRIRNKPKIHSDYEPWDKICLNKAGFRFSEEPKSKTNTKVRAKPKTKLKTVTPAPKTKTVKNCSPPKLTPKVTTVKLILPDVSQKTQNFTKLQNETNELNNNKIKIDSEILTKKHLQIDNSKSDVILSCKGLASMTKVSKYFAKIVLDNEKIFKCKFGNKCQFQTNKGQKIAEHINLSHIGVDFKCPKPNCNKVFKNPHSYREHQKNHICGFGIFGYGSKGVIGVCRNENLFKYRERIIIDGKKLYRCKVCFAVTPYFTGIKRHLHSVHICPFRVTRNPLAIKQEIMDFELDQEIFKTPFFCCTKCNEYFLTYEELEKHEIMFCRFRDEVLKEILKAETAKEVPKTEEENKPKPQTNGTGGRVKLSEQIWRNVNTINESIAKNLSNYKRRDSETEKSIVKYIFSKNFEGIDFYLCKFNDDFECKYICRQKDKMNEHILEKHFPNGINSPTDLLSNSFKSPVFPMNIKLEKMDIDDNEEAFGDLINSSTSVLQSFQINYSIEQHIEIKSFDGELNYFCVYDTKKCNFFSNKLNEMQTHVKESHDSFVCDLEDCGKQFKNALAFNAHKVNHICGFGIKGRKSSGICSLENVKKYCGTERLENDQMVFQCKWDDCKFVSKTRNNLWSHCHSRHLCPNQEKATNGSLKKTIVGRKTKELIPKIIISLRQ